MIRVKLNKCQLKFSAPCKMGSVTTKDSDGFIIVFIGLFGAKVAYPLLLCACLLMCTWCNGLPQMFYLLVAYRRTSIKTIIDV